METMVISDNVWDNNKSYRSNLTKQKLVYGLRCLNLIYAPGGRGGGEERSRPQAGGKAVWDPGWPEVSSEKTWTEEPHCDSSKDHSEGERRRGGSSPLWDLSSSDKTFKWNEELLWVSLLTVNLFLSTETTRSRLEGGETQNVFQLWNTVIK